MLLILDLDDTLIDTTGGVRGRKLEMALDAMVAAGFSSAPNKERLFEIDQSSSDMAETLERFVEEGKGEAELVEIGLKAYYGPLPPDLDIPLLEGAKRSLSRLAELATLVLVTVGDPEQQWEKLQRSGLDLDLFDRIEMVAKGPKGEVYERILKEADAPLDQVIVCGDKIEADLAPAKRLGARTVQMVWGHAARREGGEEAVDYKVGSLSELFEVARKWHNSLQ